MQSTHSRTVLSSIFRQGKLLSYAKNDTIVQDGDTPNGIHYIESGYIKVYSLNERGEEFIHLLYGPGDLFPVLWMLGTMRPNTYYSALSDCVVYRLTKEEVKTIAGLDNPHAMAMFEQVIRQFKTYIDRVDNLEYKYARERLVYRLLYLAYRFGTKHKKTYTIEAPMTQHTLANSINLSRETVSREFDRLIKKGLVTIKNHKITLHDVPTLARELPDRKVAERLGLV